MKYYIISAAINFGILLIPIATPVLKQKLEEKKEKQTIIVNLKNSILEENNGENKVDMDNEEKINRTGSLKKSDSQSKNVSDINNQQSHKINILKRQSFPKSLMQPKIQQSLSQAVKSSKNSSIPTIVKPKESSKSVLSQDALTSPAVKTSQQALPLTTVTKSNNTKLSQTNETNSISKNNNSSISRSFDVSKNSASKTERISNLNSGLSMSRETKNKNGDEGNNKGKKNRHQTGLAGNSASVGQGKDKSSGTVNSSGCKEGRDFSVSYNSRLKLPLAAQRLGKTVTVMVKIKFTRGGSVSILGASGGNSVLQAQAIQGARGIHINFITDNCSSGVIRKPFTFN